MLYFFSSSNQVKEFLEGLVNFSVSRFDGCWGLGFLVGFVNESRSSQGSIESFAQEGHENGNFLALNGEPITVAVGKSLDQSMGAEFAQIVTKGSDGVVGGVEFECVQDSAAQFLGAPASKRTRSPAQEHLEQAHHADLVQANAGDLVFAQQDGFGQTGQEIKLAVDVQVDGLIGGESIQGAVAGLADLLQTIQALPEVEIRQVIGKQFQAQVGAPLLVLPEKAVLPIGAEDMTALAKLFQDGLQFTVKAAMEAMAKDLADAIGRKAVEAQFTAALKDVADRPVALEDHVPAVFDLLDGPGAAQSVAGQPLLGRELGAQRESPIVQALANDLSTEAIGHFLESFGVLHGGNGIILLAMGKLSNLELASDEFVPIDIRANGEGDEGGYPQGHGSQNLIVDMEIVMPITEELGPNHPVIGIFSGVAELNGTERTALFHGHEDEVNAKALSFADPLQRGGDDFFMAKGLAFGVAGRPDQRDFAIAGVAFHPADVMGGAATEDLFGNDGFFEDVAEEVDDVMFGAKEVQVTGNDDAIKAVINELNPRGEQFSKEAHRRPFSGSSGPGRVFTTADATPKPSAKLEANKTRYLKLPRSRFGTPGSLLPKALRIGSWEISNIFG